jgi:outer membrane protein assembly factor BamB
MGRRVIACAALVGAVLLSAGCSGSEDPDAEPGPLPDEMCAEGSSPMAAAYDLKTGEFRWAACAEGGGMFMMAAASEDTVWVADYGSYGRRAPRYVALDAATGGQLWRGDESQFLDEVPDDADVPMTTPPVIDGVQLGGGQQVPMTGSDAASGETLWTQPGTLIFDDVWAVGDDEVFAVENVPEDPQPPALVAYEIATGDVRWRIEATLEDTYSLILTPWHVTGDRLLTMERNLQVLTVDDGSLLWETKYPEPASGLNMFGGLANSEAVFVAFTSVASPGA